MAWMLPWQATVMAGWTLAAGAYVTWTWRLLLAHDATTTASFATRVDESRFATDVALLGACIASLLAVGLLLVKAAQVGGAQEAWLTALAVASVLLAWA